MKNGRFLFLIYGLNGGGAERVMSVLCNELAQRGHTVHLGLYKRTENDYEINEQVRIHKLSESKGGNKVCNMLHRIRQTSELIAEIEPDYVIPFMGTVVTESYFASRGKSCTFISAVRVDPMNMQLNTVNYQLIMHAYRHSDGIFVQNETQKQFFPPKLQKKTFAIFNPVSEVFLKKQHSFKGSITRIATGGRLTNQKNHKMLIEAMDIVRKKHPDVQLTIYGEGTLHHELANFIAEKGVQDNVSLFGRAKDMVSALLCSDLFVLSSDYEGMPNALLEAMALGMPCISTDCRTGPRDMIVSYESGILTPVKDSEKMARAINYMIENPEKASAMGKKAREFVEMNCTQEIVADKFLAECERTQKR